MVAPPGGHEALSVPRAEALGAACAAFRRANPPFRPRDLLALAAAHPAHDAGLDPAYRDAVVRFHASSVLGERAVAASAARAARTAPFPLREGFAAQAADEERHAALDELRLALLGVDPGSAREITPAVAREVEEAVADPDPLRRMFVTNFIGETALAGATFPFVVALAEANGDPLSAQLNRARLADERRHVRFAVRTFEILAGRNPRNRAILQRWQDEHFARAGSAFLEEVAPALDRAPNRPAGDWLGAALEAYRRRASRLGLRPP